MTAFLNHFAFEFKTGIRNKTLLMMNYLFPLGFYLMMGAIMAEINPQFREDLIPAMAVFSVLAATLLGIPDQLVTAREKGIYRSYKINGIPSFSILVIPALTTALHMVIVSIIIVATAPLLFDAPMPENMLNFVITFLALTISSAGISVLIGVVSPSSRMTVLWSQLIFLPSMIVGGLMMPAEFLPETIRKFAQLLPASQAMNAFNGLSMGKAALYDPWLSVLMLALSGLIALGLAMYMFSWDSRNTDRKGHPLLALLVLLPFAVTILF